VANWPDLTRKKKNTTRSEKGKRRGKKKNERVGSTSSQAQEEFAGDVTGKRNREKKFASKNSQTAEIVGLKG